jgi:hypothetical protein
MKSSFLFALIFLAFIFGGFCQVTSEWRGPGRTGVYNESGLLKKWPITDQNCCGL